MLLTDSKPATKPAADVASFDYDIGNLRHFREFVADAGAEAELSKRRVSDLVTAAAELAANSIVHGGGSGVASIWCEPEALVFEARDAGQITDAGVGTVPPSPEQEGGRGLWIADHLCDSVQIRSSESGTAVRLRLALN